MRKLNKQCEYFHSTTLYDCPKCGKKLRDFYVELKAKVDAVPLELKQIFLDHLKDKNVGDAMKATDPDGKYENIIWYNIVGNQIETMSYSTFNFKAK